MKMSTVVALSKGDLENALVSETPGGIERQEAEGQRRLAADQTLPIKCPRSELEQLGFVFGEQENELFVHVQFPEGWVKHPTDHAMWTDLMDNKGRKRGAIFYKAAFYDERAEMNLICRYAAVSRPVNGWGDPKFDVRTTLFIGAVTDGDKVIWRTQEEVPSLEDNGQLRRQAQDWIKDHYPDHDNPVAYWDD